jgi:hypothetical protein
MTWPDSLPLPSVSNHARSGNPFVLITEMESGRKRVRRNLDLTRQILQVQWNFTRDQFDQFRQFFEKDLNRGVNSFEVLEGIAAFHPPTYSFTYEDGLFSVTATWVLAPITNTIIPEACAPLYRTYVLAGSSLDADACIPPNVNVSGTTFDGYAEGLYKPPTNTMQVAGRGITGIYIGDAAFYWPLGTTFECLPEGPLVLVASGSGITEVFAGDSAFYWPRNFDFEQYQTGSYSGGPVNVTGFTEVFAGNGT